MFSRWALNWRFSKATQRAGIGHWHAHDGRHTAVSIMSGNGVPIQEISIFGDQGHNPDNGSGRGTDAEAAQSLG